jgi:hypothetical protein
MDSKDYMLNDMLHIKYLQIKLTEFIIINVDSIFNDKFVSSLAKENIKSKIYIENIKLCYKICLYFII